MQFYEGETYKIVHVGTQCWMAENLNVGQRIDGDCEMEDNAVTEKYCYNDDENNCEEYGGLYSWDELMQYTSLENAQGICPEGWHIPDDEVWKILEGRLTVNTEWEAASGIKLGPRVQMPVIT